MVKSPATRRVGFHVDYRHVATDVADARTTPPLDKRDDDDTRGDLADDFNDCANDDAAPPHGPAHVLSGALSPGFRVADVPLQGPGLWVLDTSTVIQAHLQCASRSVVVNSRVVIMTAQNCQLQLISTNREVTPTWQLTPVR